MQETAITANAPPSGASGLAEDKKVEMKPRARATPALRQVLERFASLRITVILFLLSMVLVFWGTWAQEDSGTWTVVNKYFRAFYVWVPWRVVFFNKLEDGATTIPIPFPGGLTLGCLMLVNLLAAHAVRFKLAWNRVGIIIIHVGIIIMMLSELFTYLYAVEGMIAIPLGKSSNQVFHSHQTELAVIRTVDAKKDEVVVVPANLLQTGAKVHDERLPFDVEVIEYMVNSKLINKRDPANRGLAASEAALPVPEGAGAGPNQKVDVPSIYVRLTRNGEDLGVWLFSVWYADTYYNVIQEITAGGKTYKITLRYKERPRDFSMHLTKFNQEFYPGTEKPKDYCSYIHLTDPTNGTNRDVEIYMNAPLTYRGETFYQADVTNDQKGNAVGTVLQVVHNPSWVLPYLSCFVVGVGLLMHFGLTLYRFINRRIVR